MSKNSTTYTVQTLNAEGEVLEVVKAGISKKQTALDLMNKTRDESELRTQVVTSAGNSVAERAAKRKIKMSPRYTRVVELPEGVEVPAGQRVAYVWPRKGFALLDASKGEYTLIRLADGSPVEDSDFATTRDAGRFVADYVATPEPELEDAEV